MSEPFDPAKYVKTISADEARALINALVIATQDRDFHRKREMEWRLFELLTGQSATEMPDRIEEESNDE